MKKWLAATALIALCCACGNKNKGYDASGTFEATEIIVSSEVTGKIVRFDVFEGDSVVIDSPLGYIDTIQLHLKKLQLQASIKAVLGRLTDTGKQVAATKEQIATMEREHARFQKLVESNAANQKQVDDINSQTAVLRRQLTAQQSLLESGNKSILEESDALKAQVEQIDDMIRRSTLTSPISGTILNKYAEAGESTMPGKALFKVADINNMFLRAYVTSGQLSAIKTGQEVRVFADYGGSRKEYTGRVVWISGKAEFTPKSIQTKDERDNLVYAIKISVKNDGYIKIGMYGEIIL